MASEYATQAQILWNVESSWEIYGPPSMMPPTLYSLPTGPFMNLAQSQACVTQKQLAPFTVPTSDGQKIALPPINLRPPEEERREYPQSHGASREHGPLHPSQQIVSQPPAPYPAMSSGDDRTVGLSRGLGMRTILNPTEPEGDRHSPALASNTQSPLMGRLISQRGTPVGFARSDSGGAIPGTGPPSGLRRCQPCQLILSTATTFLHRCQARH